MLLTSTRDKRESANFREALIRGLAPSGGLYIPKEIPSVMLESLKSSSLKSLGSEIFEAWLGDEYERQDFDAICDKALNFPIPLQQLSEDGLYVLELFHGPTLSFKDIAARCMAGLMEHALVKLGEKLTILVATSGDTGSAVADAFSYLENIDVVILYPKNGVSPIQEMQLTSRRKGLKTCRVDGSFDDCQRMVKKAFTDKKFDQYNLSSANSINIGRLIPQTIYYYSIFAQLGGTDLTVAVPCGNLGNLTAGLLAAESIGRKIDFVAAHNANNSMVQYLAGQNISSETTKTLANAMDVSIPSNLERLTTLFTMSQLKDKVSATWKSDNETIRSMRYFHERFNYVADPHTAIALAALEEKSRDTPRVCLATAHPAKFPEAIKNALGIELNHEGLESLKEMDHDKIDIGTDYRELQAVLEVK